MAFTLTSTIERYWYHNALQNPDGTDDDGSMAWTVVDITVSIEQKTDGLMAFNLMVVMMPDSFIEYSVDTLIVTNTDLKASIEHMQNKLWCLTNDDDMSRAVLDEINWLANQLPDKVPQLG